MDEKPKTPKDIVRAAVKYYKSVADIDIKRLRLEEIIEGKDAWHVTLSYLTEDDESIFGRTNKREYKEFIIDPKTADVKSMKIKQL